MRRWLQGIWLVMVLAAVAYLGFRAEVGITFESNLLALLPEAAQDATLAHAEERVAAAVSRNVVFLVGHADADRAHAAGRDLAEMLTRSGLVASVTATLDAAVQQRLAAAYFPYRQGLLSEADRAQLQGGSATSLVDRARSLVFGPGAVADGKLLARDPFLLLPAFLAALPVPQSRLSPEDGILSVHDGGLTYVFVSAQLTGDAYSLAFEDRFDAMLAPELDRLAAENPGLVTLRTGALFYAREGAREAMWETSTIGLVSTVASLGMILAVFRRLRPILLGALAIAVGIACALASTLAWFGSLHTVALLMGASLIGISVDYSLQYFCEYFNPAAATPAQRLKSVLPGIAIGLGTTLIGYLTLMLAPFPGLRQVAAFSVVGLVGSGLTVGLWYPALDQGGPVRHGAGLTAAFGRYWGFWDAPLRRPARRLIYAGLLAAGLVGLYRLHIDDDVRHLQSLAPALKRQEAEIQRLTGSNTGTQFLVVQGGDTQHLLETEEILLDRLAPLRADGQLAGFQAPAQFVPSIKRQRDTRALVRERLETPYLAAYLDDLGFEGAPDLPSPEAPFLTPAQLPRDGPLALVHALMPDDAGPPLQLVLLNGLTAPAALREAIEPLPGVQLVSLADDWSGVFATYRRYAVELLALSAGLMLPLLLWRYGWRGAIRIMLPSAAAAGLAAPLAALAGVTFTFFNAMALVLVLSIGVDYAIFCRETSRQHRPITLLAVALAALSTILSFGLLSLSQVFAVHAFGVTVLAGILVAFLLAPTAGETE